MSIRAQIDKDLIQAIRDKNEVVKDTLRMLKTEFVTHGSSDDVDVLVRAIKSRQQSIEAYREGNREDLAAREAEEIEVVQRYLPKALTDDEAETAVRAVVAELGLESKKDMSKAMKVLNERYKGRVDGKTLSTIVGRVLH